ncbi:hypothetical protein CL630_02685 [bacterium]|nr:hypothetical protein [bacterium]|tara:strand:+ start:1211 stop:1471 length:261 start_codon:yes stop_codon:yes gene_type:complete
MDFNIGTFLKKFEKLTPPDDFLKKTLISILEKEISVSIKRSDICVNGGIVYLSTSPVIKNEIFMKKPLILERLNSVLPQKGVVDIR